MDTEQIVESVSPVFGDAGAAWYFTPETTSRMKAIGLDAFRGYMLGRGGVLGPTTWRVVHSAFGYFKPSVVEHIWSTGLERCPLERAVSTFRECSIEFGEAKFADLSHIEAFCSAAEKLVTVAAEDSAGLALFAGYADQPLSDAPGGRAAQLIINLRELRGSVHLVQVVAAGIPTPVAHAIRRPDDLSLFGWSDGEVEEPTEAHRQAWDHAQKMTDQAMTAYYRSLSDSELEAISAFAGEVRQAVPPLH